MSVAFGVFISAMGVWMLVLGWQNLKKSKRARAWPTVPGEITESHVRKRPGSNASYEFEVKYEYQVDGRTLVGKRLSVGGEITSGRSRAERYQQHYPAGSVHQVHYDPDNPEDAFLEPKVAGGGWFELLGGVFGIAIGVSLLLGVA